MATPGIRVGDPIESWGYVGTSHTFTKIPLSDREQLAYGVERVCNPSELFLPPFKGDALRIDERFSLPLWRLSAETAGQTKLTMQLGSDSTLQYSTLYEVSERLRRTKPKMEDESYRADLLVLDSIFDRLASVIGTLNKHNLGIGLVDPRNVIYYFDNDKNFRLVLPDLFFFDRGEGNPPVFISQRLQFVALWEDEDASHAAVEAKTEDNDRSEFVRWFQDASKKLKDKSVDARTLARLIAWSLTGTVAPISQHSPTREAEIWSTLKRADGADAAAAITSAERLGLELRDESKRPSAYFTGPRLKVPIERGKKRAPWTALRWLTLLVMAGVILFLAWKYTNFPPPPAPTQKYWLCEACEEDSPIHKILVAEQLPLNAAFREVYPNDKQEFYDLEVKESLLVSQLDNLKNQVKVLVSVSAVVRDGRSPTAAELACLTADAERLNDCFGNHCAVLAAQLGELNEVTQKKQLVADFHDAYCEFRKLPFVSVKGEPTWYAVYRRLLAFAGIKEPDWPEWLSR